MQHRLRNSRHRKPVEYGVPEYRKRVLYIPQRQSLLPGTPREFVKQIHKYSSRKNEEDNEAEAVHLAGSWSLPEDAFDRPWSSLSGGESQRAALAIGCTLKSTEILLLDGKHDDSIKHFFSEIRR